MKETPFYKSNWFTILMLIVFFPVGLILMWANKKWTVTARIVVSIVIVVLAIVGYSTRDSQTGNVAASSDSAVKEEENGSSNSKQESKKNVEKDEKEKDRKEKSNGDSETKKDPDKLSKESLVKDIQKLVGKKAGDKQKVAKVDLISTADDDNQPKKTVNITLNGSDNLTSKMIKQGMFMDAEKIFPKVFENKEVERVILIWNFPLVDVKGNSKSEKVLSIQLERKTNEEINWENFDRNNFALVSDSYYEHPVLNK
ncbi:hypothetical protein [Bacillus paralicheniformis]|uniref:Uncharacterized protein n=1 Tax=Bacillus paralicheniformis TaxID=1648923 RepID=A0A7Z1B1F9_9BACI|nr:hypothetical protein [Bacillus paralicheniformis]KRT92241.1 hypothetical protein ACH97_200035 [Bacillus paralicheniformis]MDE1454675.1 hypothetical protein [Bacillus paralicheniformis]OLF86325.1 hypothetical protein B4121_4516 [Bacillus paralicheniformis]